MTSCYGLQLVQWLEHFDREQDVPIGWRPARLDGVNRSEGKTVGSPRLDVWQARAQRLGIPAVGRALGREGVVGRRFARTLARDDLLLPPALADDLARCFAADLAVLRGIVGPEMDLWGLA